MAFTIRFDGSRNDPFVSFIRQQARAEGWSGIQGFKEFAKITYKATLRSGIYDDWTSISFPTLADMNRFKKEAGCDDAVDYQI